PGPSLVHMYRSLVVPCARAGDCDSVTQAFISRYPLLRDLSPALAVLPLLTGIFWGAPLIARELESGTFRLAWTQSVSRTRWLAVKVAVVGLISVAVTGALTLMVGWWSSLIDKVGANRFGVGVFGERGVAPLGYAAFAFALGLTLGLLIRRTLPAMAAAVVIFTAVRMSVALLLREHFIKPVHAILPFNLSNLQPSAAGANAWTIADQTINAAGKVFGANGGFGPNGQISIGPMSNGTGVAIGPGVGTCPNLNLPALTGRSPGAGPGAVVQQCINQLHIRTVVTYQPASRYWGFQWREFGLFLLIALLLVGFCFWWLRRRLA
ncbi:MAG: ABC transporter permease, partial [Actinomycetota bacterium]